MLTQDQLTCNGSDRMDQNRVNNVDEAKLHIDVYLNNDSIDDSVVENSSNEETKIFHISVQLQRAALMLMDNFANEEGTSVNYKGMRKSQEFKEYTQIASKLRQVCLSTLAQMPDSKRLSFFANLYNALILHATCVLGAPEDTPQSRSAFFSGMICICYSFLILILLICVHTRVCIYVF